MTEQNKPGVATGVFTSPIDKEYHPVPTSHYGRRSHPVTGEKGKHHNGVDIGLRDGQRKGIPHLATDGGIVTYAGPAGIAGNVVVIDHGNGVVSRYFHLAEISKDIKKGTPVAKGQVIGEVGATGRVSGIHVHWEVLRGTTNGVGNGLGSDISSKSVNPEPFLKNGNYSKLIVQKSTQAIGLSVDNPVDQQGSNTNIQEHESPLNNDQSHQPIDSQQVELDDLYKRLYDLATEASGGDKKKLVRNLAEYGETGETAYAKNDPAVRNLPSAEQQQEVHKAFSASQNVVSQNTL
jgi:Peptidase family M23